MLKYRKIFWTHKGVRYETRATPDLSNYSVRVEVLHRGQPVTVTFPDGFRATRVYQVDLPTALGAKHALGLDAVSALMDTARSDLVAII